ncbi:MAG: ABC transporter ATP-binding protein [Gammaproteobacteria bacterium]
MAPPQMAQDAPALDVRSLSVEIHGRSVVTDVGFSVPRGGTTALVGESGCGKSITALALINLLPQGARVTGGSLHLGGDDLTVLDAAHWERVRGRRIGMIFQDPANALDPLMPVGRQIAEALRLRGLSGTRALREAAREMLSHVGIANADQRLDQYPFELSGGMCQRVMIVIALAARAELLIADEPTTALDVTIQAQILALMQSLQRETGTAILLITHDMGVVAETADTLAVMYAGTVVEWGRTADVLAAPAHPYTKALLRAIPTLQARRGARLDVIDGVVPEPSDWPAGRRFAPRCPHVRSACRVAPPPMHRLGAVRGAACIRVSELN